MTSRVNPNLTQTITISEKKMADILPLQNPKMAHMSVGECYQKQTENGLSLIKSSCNYPSQTQRDSIEFWQSLLGLGNWQINTIRISEMQVIDDHYGDIPGHEFVGVTIDNEFLRATIYHTRSIFEDDIIHELLHVRFQEWTEEEVVNSTDRLQNLDNPKSFIAELKAT